MNAEPQVVEATAVQAEFEPAPAYPIARQSTSALVLSDESMDRMLRVAQVMSNGVATIPKHLQRNPADCLAVIMQSMQWRMNPFAVAQKTHLVNGILGYEAQLVNAVITSMAPTKDRIHYEWFGKWEAIVGKFKEIESKNKKDDDGHFKKYRVPAWDIKAEEGLGVKVWATMKGESEPRELTLLMTQARTRNSPLWADDPKQQLAYLAVKRWSRLYCPDVILGVYSRDELEEIDVTPTSTTTGAPKTAKEAGERAKVVVEDSEHRNALIEGMKKIAMSGGSEALNKHWQALEKADRYAVGTDGMNEVRAYLKELEEQRASALAAEKATAEAATPDRPADPTAGAAAPSYDELMDGLIEARCADDIAMVRSCCGHLNAQEKAEVLAGCDAKDKEFGNV